MKNLLKKLGGFTAILMVLVTIGTTPVALAGPNDKKPPADSPSVQAAKELLPSWYYEDTSTDGSKVNVLSNVADRTKGSWSDILSNIIKTVLAITGALAFIAFTFSGIMLITARGAEEQIKKGKEMIYLSILGLAIIAASYAIVLGISNLKF